MEEYVDGGYKDREVYFPEMIELWQWENHPPLQELYDSFNYDFGKYIVMLDGAIDVLKAIKEKGYILGCITNGVSSLQNIKLDTAGIRDMFDVVVVSGDIGIYKPDRRIFDEAIRRAGIENSQALYVGDHPVNDIQGALGADMKAVRMNYGDFKGKGLGQATVAEIESITELDIFVKYFFFDNSRQIIVSVLKACNYRTGCRSFNRRSYSLLVVVDRSGYTSVGLGNAYHTVIYIVGIRRDTVCPVGDTDEIVVCVIRIGYCRVIGVNNLGKVPYCVILVTNDLAVGIGVARYTVESIVGSRDRTVAIGDSQHVAVCVIGIAYRAFGRRIARNSAHSIVEYLTHLTARVGDLFANIEFIVLIALSAA